MGKKVTIDYIRDYVKSHYGVTTLSIRYKNNTTPIKFRDINGQVFYKPWSSIIKTDSCHPNIKISSYIEAKEFIESYNNLGYTYKLSENEYNNQEVKNGNRIYSITHPKLSGIWYTTLTNFRRDAETHLNTSGRSYGELVVRAVLIENSIDFSEQVTIDINCQTHRFDFYIDEYNLFIEYDGEQHYKKSTGFYKYKTSIIKQRDEVKNKYVRDIGSKILRIDYTHNTIDSIANLIEYEIGTKLKRPKVVYSLNDREIAEVYLNHSLSDTASILGIHSTTVTSAFKKVYGMTKREYKRLSKNL